jgi:hypothetical protein
VSATGDGAGRPDDSSSGRGHGLRVGIGLVLGILTIAYEVAVVFGGISSQDKLTLSDLSVLVVGLLAASLLVWPQLLRRVQGFEFGSVKVQLRDLRVTQQKQEGELVELRSILSMLVTNSERVHLTNLQRGKTAGYLRNDFLDSELRRLRAMGFLHGKRYVSEIPAPPARFDLSDWFSLTEVGSEYLRRWNTASSMVEHPADPGVPGRANGDDDHDH